MSASDSRRKFPPVPPRKPKDPVSGALSLLFDSGGGSYPEVISSAQAEWFRHKSQEINPDSRPCVGSINKESVAPQEAEMGIMKILVKRSSIKLNHYEFLALYKNCLFTSLWTYSSLLSLNLLLDLILMLKYLYPSFQSISRKLWGQEFEAVFVGHNHGLDWCCPYWKLWLCFARHTGYGGYGNWARGARIVEITEDPFSIKSWIRMEDGDVHSEVILS
ncbi:hypothetical protein Pint_17752 [Pistacia integerrima]|uniref:Uncharacterized protein n=1 Tax=Pistacia integerrima TaxID=434235 RepID=A0ACC0YWU7_9ROSI|nr:hypothetical protein Pint_17752 [Pistacia integerrima]